MEGNLEQPLAHPLTISFCIFFLLKISLSLLSPCHFIASLNTIIISGILDTKMPDRKGRKTELIAQHVSVFSAERGE